MDNLSQFREEDCRLSSFGEHTFSEDNKLLAKAGFFYTQIGNIVKCHVCSLEFDAKVIEQIYCIIRYHKEQKPDCVYARDLEMPKPHKKFVSYNSLRHENVRLDTFIEWPIKWIHPSDLARAGFYYLRTSDHCACVFCRGIVGAWEVGDTAEGEHLRHFPHCPFIRGQPVGNISIKQSKIISRWMPNIGPSSHLETGKHDNLLKTIFFLLFNIIIPF